MGARTLELYQGEEWETNRRSVAQVYDTLDRITHIAFTAHYRQTENEFDKLVKSPAASVSSDAKVQEIPVKKSGKTKGGSGKSQPSAKTAELQSEGGNSQHMTEGSLVAVTASFDEPMILIRDLCDDLAAELCAVEADLQPFVQNNLAMRWQVFELRFYMEELRKLCGIGSELVHSLFIERLSGHTDNMRETLRSLDR